MPAGIVDARAADALAGRVLLDHDVDGGVVRVGVIAGKDINGVGAAGRARDEIRSCRSCGLRQRRSERRRRLRFPISIGGSSSGCW